MKEKLWGKGSKKRVGPRFDWIRSLRLASTMPASCRPVANCVDQIESRGTKNGDFRAQSPKRYTKVKLNPLSLVGRCSAIKQTVSSLKIDYCVFVEPEQVVSNEPQNAPN